MSRSGGVLRQDCRRTRAGDTSTSLAGAAARPTLSSLLHTADFVRQRRRRLCGVRSEAACLRHGQRQTSPPCCSLPPHTWRWQLQGAPLPAPGAHDMRAHHSLSPGCRTGLAANSLATSTVGCAHRRSLPGATRIRGGQRQQDILAQHSAAARCSKHTCPRPTPLTWLAVLLAVQHWGPIPGAGGGGADGGAGPAHRYCRCIGTKRPQPAAARMPAQTPRLEVVQVAVRQLPVLAAKALLTPGHAEVHAPRPCIAALCKAAPLTHRGRPDRRLWPCSRARTAPRPSRCLLVFSACLGSCSSRRGRGRLAPHHARHLVRMRQA